MKLNGYLLTITLGIALVSPTCRASFLGDDSEPSHQLSLADLVAYRAALSGRADR